MSVKSDLQKNRFIYRPGKVRHNVWLDVQRCDSPIDASLIFSEQFYSTLREKGNDVKKRNVKRPQGNTDYTEGL